jgi:sec-independent protein translocase protein TatA
MDFRAGGAQNGYPQPTTVDSFWRKIMGLAMSVPQLLIILVIVALIFGTKRLKDIGGDLGGALKSFRKAMNTGDTDDGATSADTKLLKEPITKDDKVS